MEYIGYAASFIVLISLLMSSVRKLRWINLLGSITFAVYGFLIGSLPVAILNIGTAIINIYYLYHMYLVGDYFKVLPIKGDGEYFENFLSYYEKDIKRQFPDLRLDLENAELSFYILRNIVPAGVFVCSRHDGHTLKIDLDYVVPNYRDFKIGKYIFMNQKQLFLDRGYDSLVAYSIDKKHIRYLEKMGFVVDNDCVDEDKVCYRIKL